MKIYNTTLLLVIHYADYYFEKQLFKIIHRVLLIFTKYRHRLLKSLNILILNYEYPPLGGGAGIVTKHLAEEFVKMNHSVVVVTTWFPGEAEFFTDGKITIVRLKSLRKNTYQSNPLEMFSWWRHAINYFKQQSDENLKFDICLSNFTMPGGVVARYLKHKYQIPYVVLSHGHDIPWTHPKIMFFWHLLFYQKIKNICLASSANILLSKEIKVMADRFLGEKYAFKNKVFFNGLYIDRFNKSIQGDKLKIIFVGRLVLQKSPMLFLETIKRLQSEGIPFEAVILGDGELKKKMEDFVEKNHLFPISFKGKVSHAEVLKELSASNLLVSTSESEGMSLAILEAISTGVYVVATKVSGNDNMIVEGINGNLVSDNDPDQLLSKIKAFYFEKLLKNYSYPDNYLELMDNLFSWDRIAKQYSDLFLEITS